MRFLDRVAGFDVIADRHLRMPRLERERGSGYVNLSAATRNRARLTEARRVYVMQSERKIIVPAWFAHEFVLQLQEKFGDAS